jgi:hypothetical protein
MMSMSLTQARDGQGITARGPFASVLRSHSMLPADTIRTEQLAGTHLYAERVREALIRIDVGRKLVPLHLGWVVWCVACHGCAACHGCVICHGRLPTGLHVRDNTEASSICIAVRALRLHSSGPYNITAPVSSTVPPADRCTDMQGNSTKTLCTMLKEKA